MRRARAAFVSLRRTGSSELARGFGCKAPALARVVRRALRGAGLVVFLDRTVLRFMPT